MCAEKSEGTDPNAGDTTRGSDPGSVLDKTVQERASKSVNNLSDPELIRGKVLVGEYEILSHLGSGAMGAVYKARHTALKKDVAIKVLISTAMADPIRRERFMREARAAAALNHVNLAGVHYVGFTDNNQPFFVMDLLDGQTLEDHLEKHISLTADEFKTIFEQVAKALHHAHSKGIIHRDIKPSNIMLTRDEDGKILVKLVDFGIAIYEDESGADANKLTRTGVIIGTPHYMSPEQIEARALTPGSDIYSLGCVMYEALTGNPPFSGASAHATMVLHVSTEPEPINFKALRSETPQAASQIIMRCLKKNPADRYANAKDISTALQDWKNSPVEATTKPASANLADKPDAVAKPSQPNVVPGKAKAIVVEKTDDQVELKIAPDPAAAQNQTNTTNTEELPPQKSDFQSPGDSTLETTSSTIHAQGATKAFEAGDTKPAISSSPLPPHVFKDPAAPFDGSGFVKIFLFLLLGALTNPITNSYQITAIAVNEMRDDGILALAKLFMQHWNDTTFALGPRAVVWVLFMICVVKAIDFMMKKYD